MQNLKGSSMKYVIKYTDGAYEHREGSGFPSTLLEAKLFDTREEAQSYADQNLCMIDCVEAVSV